MKAKRKKTKRQVKEQYVKVCPSCGSINITLWTGAALGMIYQCKDCQYHGAIIEIPQNQVKEYRRRLI